MSRKPPLIWTNILVFTITFLIAAIGVPLYGIFVGYDAAHWISAVLCIGFCGVSITAGYHRMWSHRAYQANGVIRFFYAIGGAFALQNSALHWASDHRVHHQHVDQNDVDPYSAKRGFWFSHIGWMLREYQAHRYDNYENVRDLQRDPIVMWQHKYYLPLVLATNFGIPILIGLVHGDVIGMLLVVGFLRLVISHHVTFFINSLAHIWGRQPYTTENSARDNGFIALFTFGEGYHNFHHKFQFDYRNGIRWWQFDPTKWLIKTLSWLGLASNLRVCDDLRIEQAKAECLYSKSQQHAKRFQLNAEIVERLKIEYDQYLTKLNEYYQVKKQWLDLHAADLKESYEQQAVVQRYRELKVKLSEQKDRWLRANQELQLRLQPAL